MTLLSSFAWLHTCDTRQVCAEHGNLTCLAKVLLCSVIPLRSIEAISDPETSKVDQRSIYSSLHVCSVLTRGTVEPSVEQ